MIHSGEVVELELRDASDGQLQREHDASGITQIDRWCRNPLVGLATGRHR